MLFNTEEKLNKYKICFHIIHNGVRMNNEQTIRYAKTKEDALKEFERDMMFRYEIDDVIQLDKGG